MSRGTDLGNNKKLPISGFDTFELSVADLRDVMKCRNKQETNDSNKKHSDLASLALKLKSNVLSGLDSNKDDLENRRQYYGRNEIPPKPPKSIFYLAFEAIQEPTLILLIICSLVSIGLSFYHPPDEIGEEVLTRLI